jgi:hypothetical protein
MYKRRVLALLPALALLAAGGCATSGAGYGQARSGGSGVVFQWNAHDDVSGTMTARLADGRNFSGQYFQITSETRSNRIAPLWDGWHTHWYGWPYWEPDLATDFVRHYTGKVVANLQADNGQHMRCRFRLIHPSNGMAGGGEGQCPTPDGETIDATFPKA